MSVSRIRSRRPLHFSRPYTAVVAVIVMSMVVAGLAVPTANAAGPPYDGPVTQATGPAFFGPAPNPFPYCDNPTYFDPFEENINPIGRIDVTGAPNASVTTNGVTMTYELTAEGDPGGRYPGFFPFGADGVAGDQPKGVEMASDDEAVIRLSEPLFYTQWVFTDVDRANEGFFVTPDWSDPNNPGQIAVFGGDSEFVFAGTTSIQAAFNDTDTEPQPSEALAGRVQVDLLGAASGISLVRDTGSGQSGFAIGGGCEPIGVSKELTNAPTWNGSSFDVTYTIRVRNNLPSAATISADVADALAAAASGFSSGAPTGIDLLGVTLEDLLVDPAFSSIDVVSNINTSGNITTNPNFDGDADINLLAVGETIPPESEEEFVLTLQYTPDVDGPVGPTCVTSYQLLNQARVAGTADGVPVIDLSDEGADPDPGVNNGDAGTDDPTVVVFDCPPVEEPSIEIVKTVLAGPAATCPDFAGGVAGEGPALPVELGDTVTYCISVRNPGTVDVDNVVISDPQAPASFDGGIGVLAVGAEASVHFDLAVDDDTATRNVASVTGDDPAGGQLPPVSDPANIAPSAPPDPLPSITLSKTVLAGADADCANAVEGTDEFILAEEGDPVTWCFVVTNTGDVALTNVLFTDGPADIIDLDLLEGAAVPVLAIGASIEFDAPGLIPAGGIDNVASVVADGSDDAGTPLPGVDPVSDENDAAINEAGLDLNKTVIGGADGDCAAADELAIVNAGEPVTYCFTITNTGGVTMRVEQIDDVTLGITVPVPSAERNIAPGAVVVVSHVAIATQDLVNVAAAPGVPIDDDTGDPFPDTPAIVPEDPAEVDVLQADVSIEKTNNGRQQSFVGNHIPYELTVANAGPDPAVGVVVIDTLPPALRPFDVPVIDGWSCAATGQVLTCDKETPLAVGDSVTLTYQVQVLGLASPGDDLVNTATVTSDTPDPDPSDNEDTEITTVGEPPSPVLPPDETFPIVVINNPPPGPVPAPSPAPTPPSPPLAITGGAYSRWLIMASAAMTGVGGVLFVTGRRRFDDLS